MKLLLDVEVLELVLEVSNLLELGRLNQVTSSGREAAVGVVEMVLVGVSELD